MNFNARKFATLGLASVVLAAGLAHAEEPVQNVSPYLHGNLAAAQELVRNAFDKIGAAQAANDDQLGGHAARAKQLLLQANEEIKQAALAANRR
jgi:hypothetical protein